jgi:hypothetical protein
MYKSSQNYPLIWVATVFGNNLPLLHISKSQPASLIHHFTSFSNGIGGHNHGHEFHSARATRALKNINLKRAFQKSSPTHAALAFAVS